VHGYIARLVRVAAIPLLLTGAVTGTALAAPATAAVARTGSSGPAASSVTGGVLNGVAATSAGNAWAVGSAGGKTLIERWNGTAWTQVPSPGPAGSVLKGVTATSATSAWAVGAAGPAGSSKTLTLRWDGAAWKQVPSPSPAAGSVLNGVAGTAAAAASDPIVGDWHVTYGAPAVVKMTLSGGVYTETAKTPGPGRRKFLRSPRWHSHRDVLGDREPFLFRTARALVHLQLLIRSADQLEPDTEQQRQHADRRHPRG
jgi:hypothetical protein